MSSSTITLPLERARYARDAQDVLFTTKRPDEVIPLIIDWSSRMAVGDTITGTPSYSDRGVTRSSTSNTTTTTTTLVTGTGETEVTIVTTAGQTHQELVRFYAPSGALREDDYGP